MTLEARNVSVQYGATRTLSEVSLSIAPGELVALLGPNGAGKTTLFRVLAGDLVPREGIVTLGGEDVTRMHRLALARRRAALSQSIDVAFDFTVRELVEFGRAPHDDAGTSAAHAIVDASIARVGLASKTDARVDELSGGERQRAQLARILCQSARSKHDDRGPRFLLLDEPVSEQDPAQQLAVMHELVEIASNGAGVLVVLHDFDLAAAHADRIALLDRGRLVCAAAPEAVLRPEVLSEVFGVEAHVDRAPWAEGVLRVSFARKKAIPSVP